MENIDNSLSIWTICKHPMDYPDAFTARRHVVLKGKSESTSDLVVGQTLEEVRDQLPRGLYRMPRDLRDDPVIVESWL